MSAKQVAIYARVSSDQQSNAGTIDSQRAALEARVKKDGFDITPELEFMDDGFSGSTLIRPGMEKLRDMIAAGSVDCLYVLSPDRLARKYVYQILLVEEFRRAGVEIVFLNRQVGDSPEDELLLQVQGVIAEYERAKILERARRGKQHAAKRGSVNVLSKAPYGYRYINKHEGGGEARFEIAFDEARIVQQIFEWIVHERISIRGVSRRLAQKKIKSPTGKPSWDPTTVWSILRNPAYKGQAAYGRTHITEKRKLLRTARGAPTQPKHITTREMVLEDEWIYIPVPQLVDEEVFDLVKDQLRENQARDRERKSGAVNVLSGLTVCSRCGYSYVRHGSGSHRYYCCSSKSRGFSCKNKPVRADHLQNAVWSEVKALLEDPKRLESEYRRRLQSTEESARKHTGLEAEQSKVKNSMTRLIDGYADGLIPKDAFQTRMNTAKKRLQVLEKQMQEFSNQENLRQQLKLLVVQLADFTARINTRLDNADESTKRELIKMLVKHVTLDERKVNIVFRVGANPFVLAPERAFSPYCGNCEDPVGKGKT